MANLEVRVRHMDMSPSEALPLADIPYKPDLIQNASALLTDVGGVLFGVDLTDDSTQVSYQFAEDGSRAFLDLVVDGPQSQ